MIAGIASLVFIPLLAITMAHALWAFGSTWPAGDAAILARTISGTERMQPRWMSLLVGLLTLVSGLWALALSDPSSDLVLRLGGALFTLVYLGRGIAGFLPSWQASHSEQPFARMNTKLYSPLCLGLALGFAYLTVWPLI